MTATALIKLLEKTIKKHGPRVRVTVNVKEINTSHVVDCFTYWELNCLDIVTIPWSKDDNFILESGEERMKNCGGFIMISLIELEEKAKAATPGPWIYDKEFGIKCDYVSMRDAAWTDYVSKTRHDWVAQPLEFPLVKQQDENGAFIAAANPETVLMLIRDLNLATEAINILLSEVEKEYAPEGLKSPLVRGSKGLIKAQKFLSDREIKS